MARIFKKGKTSLVSSILNILGLTAAFAALYIILVQVHHDLTFNKALKDSDRIYVLTMPDRFSNNVYSSTAACAAARRAMGTRNGEQDT